LAIVCGLVFFVLGFGAGGASMIFFGYQMTPPPRDTSSDGGLMAGGGGGGGPGGGGKGKDGKGKGKGGGPSNKAQLANLIRKLDQLVGKPITLELTAEQKKTARDVLKGLDEKDELSEDDAKDTLGKMHELLRDQRKTLEAVGYVWEPVPPMPIPTAPNPFKEEATAKQLKALEANLAK
jgi:hypothetical protein